VKYDPPLNAASSVLKAPTMVDSSVDAGSPVSQPTISGNLQPPFSPIGSQSSINYPSSILVPSPLKPGSTFPDVHLEHSHTFLRLG